MTKKSLTNSTIHIDWILHPNAKKEIIYSIYRDSDNHQIGHLRHKPDGTWDVFNKSTWAYTDSHPTKEEALKALAFTEPTYKIKEYIEHLQTS